MIRAYCESDGAPDEDHDCPECGGKTNPQTDGSHFCPKCGVQF